MLSVHPSENFSTSPFRSRSFANLGQNIYISHPGISQILENMRSPNAVINIVAFRFGFPTMPEKISCEQNMARFLSRLIAGLKIYCIKFIDIAPTLTSTWVA